MKKTISGAVLVFFAATGLALAFSEANAQSSSEAWQVEIDVFSGLPNPTYTLDADEVVQLKERLSKAAVKRAATSSAESIRPSILGYRGFVLRRLGADSKEASAAGPGEAEVFAKEILQRSSDGSLSVLDDSASGLEQYLVTLARSKNAISAEVVGSIESSLR